MITHEKPDVILINQVLQMAELGTSSIKVIVDDTDVLVLLVLYAQKHLSCEIIMNGRQIVLSEILMD